MIEDVGFLPDQFNFFIPLEDKGVSKEDLEVFYTMGNTDVRTLIDFKHKLLFGFVGMLMVRAGVVEVFFLPSVHIDKHKLSVVRKIKELLLSLAERLKLRRIQMTIESTDLWKWARALGFTFEAKLSGYAPDGGPEYLFARTFKWH